MKKCKLCGKPFDPSAESDDPAAQMGDFLAGEMYADAGELCLRCLTSRGELAMMYLREFN